MSRTYDREVVHPLRHRAGEAVDGGALAEDRLEVRAGDGRGVEGAETLAERQRPRERLLDRDLLVEREADQQRHRVLRDELVGLIGFGEVQAIGHTAIVPPHACLTEPRGGDPGIMAVDDPDVAHCQVCGAQLTTQEMADALESGPPLCAVHAAEELPELDEPPPTV